MSSPEHFSESPPRYNNENDEKLLKLPSQFPKLKNIMGDINENEEINCKNIINFAEKFKKVNAENTIFARKKGRIFRRSTENSPNSKNGKIKEKFVVEYPIILQNCQWNKKVLKYEDFFEMNDNEIIGLLTNFNGFLTIWKGGIIDMKDKFMLWEGKNESTALKIYQKSIIFHVLSFKSENITKIGLEENVFLKKILSTFKEIDTSTLEFIWNYLCI